MDANNGSALSPTQGRHQACAPRHTWVVIAVGQAQCPQCQLIVPILVEEGPEGSQA